MFFAKKLFRFYFNCNYSVGLMQGGILPPIMGGKWKFEDFLPPMGETPGGQITGVLPPMGETLGGKLLLFAPHKGGK